MLFAFSLISCSSNRAHCSFSVQVPAFSFSFCCFSGKIKSCLSKTMMRNSCCHQWFCHLQSSRISYVYSDYQSHKFVTGKAVSGVLGWNCPRSFLLLNVNWLLVCLKMTLSCPRMGPLLEPVFVGSFQSTVVQMCDEAPPFPGDSPGCFCESVKSIPCAWQAREFGVSVVWVSQQSWLTSDKVPCEDCFMLLFFSFTVVWGGMSLPSLPAHRHSSLSLELALGFVGVCHFNSLI